MKTHHNPTPIETKLKQLQGDDRHPIPTGHISSSKESLKGKNLKAGVGTPTPYTLSVRKKKAGGNLCEISQTYSTNHFFAKHRIFFARLAIPCFLNQ